MHFLGWVTANARMHSRYARLRIESASRVATAVHKVLRSGVRRVCCAHQDPACQDTVLGVSDIVCHGFLWNWERRDSFYRTVLLKRRTERVLGIGLDSVVEFCYHTVHDHAFSYAELRRYRTVWYTATPQNPQPTIAR